MRRLRALGEFIWEFLIGDDWLALTLWRASRTS